MIQNERWHHSPNGKNASLAKAAPFASSPAFLKAILRLSSLFGCPLPMPNIQLFCKKRKRGSMGIQSLVRMLKVYQTENINLAELVRILAFYPDQVTTNTKPSFVVAKKQELLCN